MWLCIQTAINVKFCNMYDILYDKWNKKLVYLQKLNTKQTKKKHKQDLH